jgi:hypothetical protein
LPFGLPYFGCKTTDGAASLYMGWVLTFDL